MKCNDDHCLKRLEKENNYQEEERPLPSLEAKAEKQSGWRK